MAHLNFLQVQSGIELLDRLSGMAILERDHDGVERDAWRTHAQRTLRVLVHVTLR